MSKMCLLFSPLPHSRLLLGGVVGREWSFMAREELDPRIHRERAHSEDSGKVLEDAVYRSLNSCS